MQANLAGEDLLGGAAYHALAAGLVWLALRVLPVIPLLFFGPLWRAWRRSKSPEVRVAREMASPGMVVSVRVRGEA